MTCYDIMVPHEIIIVMHLQAEDIQQNSDSIQFTSDRARRARDSSKTRGHRTAPLMFHCLYLYMGIAIASLSCTHLSRQYVLLLCAISHYTKATTPPPPSVPPHLAAAAATLAPPSVSSRPPPLPSSAAKFDVFISYKHETISIMCATAVYRHLTTLGFKVYLDERELTGGDNIGKKVSAAIRGSTIFLPILSFEYVHEAGELWYLKKLHFANVAHREIRIQRSEYPR